MNTEFKLEKYLDFKHLETKIEEGGLTEKEFLESEKLITGANTEENYDIYDFIGDIE